MTTLLVVVPTRLPTGLRSGELPRFVTICVLLPVGFKPYDSVIYGYGTTNWYNNEVKNDAFQGLLDQKMR